MQPVSRQIYENVKTQLQDIHFLLKTNIFDNNSSNLLFDKHVLSNTFKVKY